MSARPLPHRTLGKSKKRLYGLVPKCLGCKDVRFNWFMMKRERALPVSYANAIIGDPGDVYAKLYLDELFTTPKGDS